MKKYSLAVVFFIFAICTTMAQQEKKMLKPKVMVVPEEAFCINSGMFKYDQAGNKIADYGAAMLNDNVLDVINTFENLMAGYGFQLTNLQQTLDELKEEAALDNVLKSKDDGSVVEDDLDKLSRVAGADILVKVSPKVSMYGPERRLELRVSSIDLCIQKGFNGIWPCNKNISRLH